MVPVLVPADVVDISFGGFAVETRCSLRVGASYAFRFTLISERRIELQAQVVHCRRKATHDFSERYIGLRVRARPGPAVRRSWRARGVCEPLARVRPLSHFRTTQVVIAR